MEKYKEAIAVSVLAAASHGAEALDTNSSTEAISEQEVVSVVQDSIERGTVEKNTDGSFRFVGQNGAELIYTPPKKIEIDPTNEKVGLDPQEDVRFIINPTPAERVQINPTNGERIELDPTPRN